SETAQKIAEVIREIAPVEAVAITDRSTILGFAGIGCPYMVRGQSILTELTRQTLKSGQINIARTKEELACPVGGCPCPLQAAVIAPLKVGERVVGTVKLYRGPNQEFPG